MKRKLALILTGVFTIGTPFSVMASTNNIQPNLSNTYASSATVTSGDTTTTTTTTIVNTIDNSNIELNFTEKIANIKVETGDFKSVIPADVFKNISNDNSINILTAFANVSINGNLIDSIPNFENIIEENNLTSDKVGIEISVMENSTSLNMKVATNMVTVGLKIVDNDGNVLKNIDYLSKPINLVLPQNSKIALNEDYIGAFNYNMENETYSYAPLKKIDGESNLSIAVYESGNFIVFENKVFFDDVANDSWFKSYVDKSASKGLITGIDDNNFNPNSTTTRAEFSQFINNVVFLENSNKESSYTDVDNTSWYYNSVKDLENIGAFNSILVDTFDPDVEITREEAASIVSNICKEKNVPTNRAFLMLDKVYTDFADIDEKYVDDIVIVYKLGIMQGMDNGKFNPKGNITRAEVAKIQLDLLKVLSNME